MDSKEKIHFINTHGLGDVIMSLPVIFYYLKKNKSVSLTLKGEVERALLLAMMPKDKIENVEIISFSVYQKKGWGGLWSYLHVLRNINTDIIVSTHSINNFRFNLLAFFSGAKKRVGTGGWLSFLNTTNLNSYVAKHKVERNIEIASLLDPEIKKIKTTIPKFKAAENRIHLYENFHLEIGAELIALAPGSGEVEKHKRWPIEKFSNLANELVALGKHVIVLGGPGEEWMGRYILDSNSSDLIYDFTGKLKIEDTLKLLTLTTTLVANCNGLSHLGSLIDNLKVVGLYGPTDPSITSPYTDHLVIFKTNMDCAPCYRRGFIEGCKVPLCMKEIEVRDVLIEVLN